MAGSEDAAAAFSGAFDFFGGTWGLGRVWGMILGATVGELAQVMLTTLFAVLIFDEEPDEAESAGPQLLPWLSAGPDGGVVGARGIF